MGFPPKIAERALLDSGRHCCLCHRFCGFKIELHHIRQVAEGGEDTYENCIPLCLDCHAEVKAYDPRHPIGRKYTESELRAHRDRWYEKVAKSHGVTANPDYVQLDRQVFRKIREILPSSGSISFVRDHCYSQPYEIAIHDDLSEFLEHCKDAEFEFLDADLEGLRNDLAERIEEFFVVLGRNVTVDLRPAVASREGRWLSVPKKYGSGRYIEFNEHYDKQYREINRLSNQVWESYEALMKLGRRKLAV